MVIAALTLVFAADFEASYKRVNRPISARFGVLCFMYYSPKKPSQ
jgi:hypothetical protein